MKFCYNCKASGKVLIKSSDYFYQSSVTYHLQECKLCQGKGILNQPINIYKYIKTT